MNLPYRSAWRGLPCRDESLDDVAPRGRVHRGYAGGPIDTPDLDPYERLQPDTQAAVAAALREQYEGGKSIRDLAADTGYSIARVRTLLECADAALRPRGAAQAADQH